MLQLICHRCNAPFTVGDERAGRRASCPRCGQHTTPSRPFPAVTESISPASPFSPLPLDPTPAEDHLTLVDVLFPPQQADELGRLGPYRILKVLGKGGMGTVFLGEDPQLKRSVALKVLNPSLAVNPLHRERFLREGQAIAALEDDHVVTIYEVDEQRGVPYLAMKLLQGETLQHRLQREGKLPVRDVLQIGKEITLGLEAAHQRGLIHRDLKPSNLWLEEGTGQVILLDFGLARVTQGDARLTDNGMIVGTPAYMSPEQASGAEVDGRSDLFSLGCVLYHLSTGELPFASREAVKGLRLLVTQMPAAPRALDSSIPGALSDLIVRLLARSPAHRPASARQVREELQAIEQSLSAGQFSTQALKAVDTPPPSALAPSPRRATFWMAGAGLLAAVGLVVLLLLLNPFGKSSVPPPEKKTVPPPATGSRLRLLVPAYFYPGGPDLKYWDQLIDSAGSVDMIVILNPDSGPGNQADPAYTEVLKRLRSAGIVSIGYVTTSYAKRPVEQIKEDIEKWHRFYPQLQGIFFDEQASGADQYNYYLSLAQYVKNKNSEALVVTNPGVLCAREFVVSSAIDVICVTEHGQDFHVRLPDWARKDNPGKLAVLIYDVEGQERLMKLLKEVSEQRIGHVFITDAGQPNPWRRLPAWWDTEVKTIKQLATQDR